MTDPKRNVLIRAGGKFLFKSQWKRGTGGGLRGSSVLSTLLTTPNALFDWERIRGLVFVVHSAEYENTRDD